MMNRIMYAGVGSYVVKINEREREFIHYLKMSDYVFFKNTDDEYELIKCRFGERDTLFLSLEDIKTYLSKVSGNKIELFAIKKASAEKLEEFRDIAIGKKYYGI